MNRNQAQQIEDKLSDGTIPKSHVLIHKSQLSILKSKAKMYDALIKNVSRDQYIGSGVADNMLGFAASCLPQAGYDEIAITLPFIIASFLENCGIKYNRDKLASSLPSNIKIKHMVEENDIANILPTQESIRKNRYVYICYDKCNKKGIKTYPSLCVGITKTMRR